MVSRGISLNIVPKFEPTVQGSPPWLYEAVLSEAFHHE